MTSAPEDETSPELLRAELRHLQRTVVALRAELELSQCKADPPPEDWRGVWVMESK